MAQALGINILDKNGEQIGLGGGCLGHVEFIDMSRMDGRILSTEIRVACDVTNPMTGPHGASCTYGPQKGADPEMVKKLDQNLKHFAAVIKDQLSMDVEDIPGAGAAGGLGAGLMAFLNAKLMKGFDMVAETVGLEKKIMEADLVITGEGKIDVQTQYGKTVFGIAQIAKKYGKPVIAVGGSIDDGAEILYDMGIDAMLSVIDRPMTLKEAIKDASNLQGKTQAKGLHG